MTVSFSVRFAVAAACLSAAGLAAIGRPAAGQDLPAAAQDLAALVPDWPALGKDFRRTGKSDYPGCPTPEVLWACGPSRTQGVAVAHGRLYVSGGGVAAIEFDGSLRWRHPTSTDQHPPTVAPDGTVYFGDNDGRIVALSEDAPGAYVTADRTLVGGVLWAYQTGAQVQTSPAVAPDGKVIAGSVDGGIYAVNPDGTLAWKYRTGADAAEATPAIYDPTPDSDPTDYTVYMGADSNALYALRPNGSLKWKFKATDDVNGGPAVDAAGNAYFTSSNWTLWSVSAAGTKRWSVPIAPKNSPGFASGRPSLDEGRGTVWVGGRDGLYAFTLGGAKKPGFPVKTGGQIWAQPAIDRDGTAYVHCWDNRAYAVPAAGGAPLWSAYVGQAYFADPAIDGLGTVYVGGDRVHAFAVGGTGRPALHRMFGQRFAAGAWQSADAVALGEPLRLVTVEAGSWAGPMAGLTFYLDANADGLIDAGDPAYPASRHDPASDAIWTAVVETADLPELLPDGPPADGMLRFLARATTASGSGTLESNVIDWRVRLEPAGQTRP